LILFPPQLFLGELIINKNMIKNLISPIQAWLLSQKRCVGCGTPLDKAKRKEVRGKTTATCRCGRIFIYDEEKKNYRRALFDEV
jgi:uncharacterized protein with PIN domain